MHRLLNQKRLASLLVAGVLIAAVPGGDAPPKAGGPGQPLAPQEALKQFRLDDGLRIELVACEPQVESPVAMAFDPAGRLWVVEMRDYPNGPDKGKPAQGRIRILEDKDGDGFFETATTWADNLLFANGLLLWKDGAIVTMAPNIAHLRDTDGDGKADTTDVLYQGFAAQNPQLRVSHPILGLDGWIYCANGLRGGKVVKAGDKNAKPVDLSGMDFRFDPITGAYEAITGPGQYGNTFDAWGNRFICDNRHHLRHVVMENRYIKRNPYLAAPALVEDISVLDDGPLSSGGKVYPISRNWTTSSLHEGRFTAACGVFIYHGKLLDTSRDRKGTGDDKTPLPNGRGSFYDGAAFTCEPTGNLVHMEVLTPKGATFTSKPAKDKVEFLATTDDWFRPVFLTHGPEGAMYVVDMYRAVIEHPDFMPPELQKRPDLWQGKDKGRIWRIVPAKHVTKTPRPNLTKASFTELFNALEHEEPWWRTTAQRLLLEKIEEATIEPLTTLLKTTTSAHARLRAAYLLERKHALSDALVEVMLQDKHPRVREHAIRLAEPRLERVGTDYFEPIQLFRKQIFVRMQQDPDDRVRYQLALTIGGINNEDSTWILPVLARGGAKDRWTKLAVQASLPKHVAALEAQLLYDFFQHPWRDPGLAPDLHRELCAIMATQKDLKIFAQLVRTLSSLKEANGYKWIGLAGVCDGLERRGLTLLAVAMELPEADRGTYLKGLYAAFTDAAKDAANPKEPLDRRMLCIRIVGHAPWPEAKRQLVPLATGEAIPELRIGAIRALAAQQDTELPSVFMKLWPSAAPPLRREILEAMLRRPERIAFLLDEIEAKRVKASEIDASRTRQLVQYGDPKIRERAKELLQDNLPGDRLAALKNYQAALTLKGDAKRGQDVFKKNCATCHRVAGIGIDVGPDIADTRTKTLGALLNDILVPNAAIDNNYVNYVVTAKDGRILTGMLATETASSITLKRAEGQMDVLLRKDIDEIASTGISLMPDGLEKNINVQEMADLLRFLKDWRYLDGSVPVNP